jgi:T-complex protein 1 subunit zeta
VRSLPFSSFPPWRSRGRTDTKGIARAGELLNQASRYTSEGVHPRVLADGLEVAKNALTTFLDDFKVPFASGSQPNHETLVNVAYTSLATKVHQTLAKSLAQATVDAVLAIRQKKELLTGEQNELDTRVAARKEGDAEEKEQFEPIDLHMVELMKMQHMTDTDTRLIKGLVLDHGPRHPDMPKRLENCFILTLNVSLEYEKTCVTFHFPPSYSAVLTSFSSSTLLLNSLNSRRRTQRGQLRILLQLSRAT